MTRQAAKAWLELAAPMRDYRLYSYSEAQRLTATLEEAARALLPHVIILGSTRCQTCGATLTAIIDGEVPCMKWKKGPA